MADDTKFKCNSNQYDVGLAVAKNISDSMVSYKDSITSAFGCLESVAETHKIDLTSTIDFSNINGDFVLADDYINDISSIARAANYLAVEYSDDSTGFIMSYQQALKGNELSDAGKRILSTVAMGGAKFGEGFLEFFEDIGDGAIILGSDVISFFGQSDLAKSWKKFALKDLSVNLVEKNKYFEAINKYSYFDKDSIYADVFKFGGKVAAGVVTGKVTSSIFSGVSNVRNIETSEKSIEQVAKYSKKISNAANSFGSNTRDGLKKGYLLNDSLAFAAAGVVADTVIDKGASKVGSKVGGLISSNDKVKSVVKSIDSSAENLFKENKSAVKKVAEKTVDFSTNEVEKKTKMDDRVSDKEKNSIINATKSGSSSLTKTASAAIKDL